MPGISSFMETIHSHLSPEVSERILAVSKGSNMAIFTILLAGVGGLVHRYTNEENVIVGMPAVAESEAPRMNDLVLLKQQVDGRAAFKGLLNAWGRTVSESVANQSIAFSTM